MVSKIEDYRCTKYDERLRDTEVKKERLKRKIVNESKYKDIRNAITEREEYKESFFGIYNTKCSYCGVDISLISYADFEVDHFMCESFCKKHDIEANYLENLVLSCRSCNRLKSGLYLDSKDAIHIYPDSNIFKTFYRNDNYKILIIDDYIDNKLIKEFYETLKLKSETRRLDYLVMSIDGLSTQCENEQVRDKLKSIAFDLSKIRRRKFSTLSQIKSTC